LAAAIKYLLLAVLLLPVFIAHNATHALTLLPFMVLIISVTVYLSRYTWHNLLLQGSIYVSGAFMVFVLENYGRNERLIGLPITVISHAVFLVLLLLVVIKVLLRRRISRLIVSPFEYLIMLIVLTVPLLPSEISGQFHLHTVAAKSVIMFVGFKLVLMRQLQRNRKIILTLVVSSLILVLRSLLEI
jgi:hypothetical protein